MKNIIRIILALFGLNATACAGDKYQNVEVGEFAKIIQQANVQLLDVRTPEEYAQGHVAGAVNLNMQDADFLPRAKQMLQKEKTVAVYCRSGRRSAMAAARLSAEGFKVVNMLGGIMAWQQKFDTTTLPTTSFNNNTKKEKNMKEIYFAGGCFWGTEHYFKQIRGVVSTEVGYANGHTDSPTYKEVCTDKTGYAETVHVSYDPQQVSLKFLTELYFKAIDPTSLNKQGHDEGTQYRTGVYFTDEADKPVIDSVFREVERTLSEPLAVELLPLKNFYTAEDYHQDYLDKNPSGYCHLPSSLFKMAKEANAEK